MNKSKWFMWIMNSEENYRRFRMVFAFSWGWVSASAAFLFVASIVSAAHGNFLNFFFYLFMFFSYVFTSLYLLPPTIQGFSEIRSLYLLSEVGIQFMKEGKK